MPQDVAQQARVCMLYGFGIGLLCVRQETARVAEASVLDIDGEAVARGATSLSSGRRLPLSSAAFANAVLLHSRCQEDSSGTAHLGVVVLSVALGLLEAELAQPQELVAGIVAGYEIGGQLEAALGRDTMAAGLRASPLYGTLAAAATAARMLRLPAERVDAALANAASFAGGTLQTIPEGSDEWRYQVGVAARTGLHAAMLARSGSVCARHAIEGPQGFAKAFARRPLSEGEPVFGQDWRMRHVTFKPYPVCAHNQTTALIGAQIHRCFEVAQIESVRLRISSYLVPGLLARGPFSRVADTLMSSAFCCACAGVHGSVTMARLGVFDDAQVSAFMDRITIEPTDALQFPAAEAEVRLRDGTTVQVAERRSFADFSLGREQVLEQLRRLAAEEEVPPQAIALLDEFAFSAQGRPALVARAFAMARARTA